MLSPIPPWQGDPDFQPEGTVPKTFAEIANAAAVAPSLIAVSPVPSPPMPSTAMSSGPNTALQTLTTYPDRGADPVCQCNRGAWSSNGLVSLGCSLFRA